MHKFNLIENANDSLEHAIQHMGPVNKNGAGDWKRIIVDIAHVVELLFKETLRRKHPAFVFENIDKYPSVDAFTVGTEKALKRLQNICDIQFSKDELNAIDTSRKKRNEIEHFEFSITEHEAKAIVGQVLSFIFSFADEHLHLEWKAVPKGMHAVVPAQPELGLKPGSIFVLKNRNDGVNINQQNRLHPYYLVYIAKDGEVIANHTEAKKLLDLVRTSCKGHNEPLKAICRLLAESHCRIRHHELRKFEPKSENWNNQRRG